MSGWVLEWLNGRDQWPRLAEFATFEQALTTLRKFSRQSYWTYRLRNTDTGDIIMGDIV